MSVDVLALGLVALALVALLRWKWGVMAVISACALAGLGLRLLGLG